MRFFRPLLQAAKTHTGFTGLMPHPRPHAALTELYESTLTKLQALPADYAYRTATAAVTKQRLALVKEVADVSELESKLGEGPIEWVVIQAQAEADLVDKMAQWKAWEPLEVAPSENQWAYAFKQK
ncbi:ETC complex I subunit conserved region-domain-containing protein [Blastocladiella britannica]|nr:ETC complex I subunit conserved region-domain-containing protein [Blastocladiella britannica]